MQEWLIVVYIVSMQEWLFVVYISSMQEWLIVMHIVSMRIVHLARHTYVSFGKVRFK